MASKIKLDKSYYLENNQVIFEDKYNGTVNVIFNAQQVHVLKLLFKKYIEINSDQNR